MKKATYDYTSVNKITNVKTIITVKAYSIQEARIIAERILKCKK